MTLAARLALPSDRIRIEGWLRESGLVWPTGPSFVRFAADGSVAALARIAEPPPGDGHHREHVRMLLVAGEAAALVDCACLAARHWEGRLEASAPATASALERALAAAGLEREVTLPRSWSEGGRLVDWHLWGRSIPRQDEHAAPRVAGTSRQGCAEPAASVRVSWHDASTRAGLARFLRSLVPGRAYPPGTLLSEAERLETSREGLLAAAWIVAAGDDGAIIGGLVLDRASERERSHVRRVHLDVAPGWQGRGVATAMLRVAREEARARLGAVILEADPREGNRGAVGALAAAGFERAGIQRGAWRLRQGARRWDEDVPWFRSEIPEG